MFAWTIAQFTSGGVIGVVQTYMCSCRNSPTKQAAAMVALRVVVLALVTAAVTVFVVTVATVTVVTVTVTVLVATAAGQS